MQSTLEDIRQKLREDVYKNEEHVRLSLVSRILQELGWNIWNPEEVNTEFVVVPDEDNSKVDIALLLRSYLPSVFIEVKAAGKLQGEIKHIETQLRDYNRNNTAIFTVITDGQRWRFYYSLTAGEFSQKCFKTIDILKDETEELEHSFNSFLSKSEIANENARATAERYLQLSQKQRVMEDMLPQAGKAVLEPPFPSLPQALIDLCARKNVVVTPAEAEQFIKDYTAVKPIKDHIQEPKSVRVREPQPARADTEISEKLTQILDVCHEVYERNVQYTEATKIVAQRRSFASPSTVADKCTRQLGLNADRFRKLLSNKQRMISFLVKRFPENEGYIRNELK